MVKIWLDLIIFKGKERNYIFFWFEIKVKTEDIAFRTSSLPVHVILRYTLFYERIVHFLLTYNLRRIH